MLGSFIASFRDIVFFIPPFVGVTVTAEFFAADFMATGFIATGIIPTGIIATDFIATDIATDFIATDIIATDFIATASHQAECFALDGAQIGAS